MYFFLLTQSKTKTKEKVTELVIKDMMIVVHIYLSCTSMCWTEETPASSTADSGCGIYSVSSSFFKDLHRFYIAMYSETVGEKKRLFSSDAWSHHIEKLAGCSHLWITGSFWSLSLEVLKINNPARIPSIFYVHNNMNRYLLTQWLWPFSVRSALLIFWIIIFSKSIYKLHENSTYLLLMSRQPISRESSPSLRWSRTKAALSFPQNVSSQMSHEHCRQFLTWAQTLHNQPRLREERSALPSKFSAVCHPSCILSDCCTPEKTVIDQV